MKELAWIEKARSYIGTKEIPGRASHNKTLLAMLNKMGDYSTESKAWWHDDETPWCGLFTGFCLGESGRYVVKDWFRASAWNSPNMTKLSKPAYGCVVTFTRQGGGHVGFVIGEDASGNLLVLGGNQSDQVKVSAFPKSRVTGYYWPSIWDNKTKSFTKSEPSPERYNLPKSSKLVQVSNKES